MSLLSQIRDTVIGLTGLLASMTRSERAESADDHDGNEGTDKAVKSDSAGPPRAELKAAADRIRATTRWIVGGFAAVAALIVGTAPLDKIGDLAPRSWQLCLAVLALLAVIGGITLVIKQAAAVDAPVGASPRQLTIAENPDEQLPQSLEADHEGIVEAVRWIVDADLVDVRDVPRQGLLDEPCPPPALPITFLVRARDAARDQWLQGELDVEEQENPTTRTEREQKYAGRKARLKRLDDELTYVVSLANYRRLDRRFDKSKGRIFLGAVLAGVGIVVFKYAAYASDEKPTPIKLEGVTLTRAIGVNLEGASLAGARLAGADLRRSKLANASLIAADLTAAKLQDADLAGANLSAANLRGADGLTPEAVKGVIWTGATCPDGTRLSDAGDTCGTDDRLDGRR